MGEQKNLNEYLFVIDTCFQISLTNSKIPNRQQQQNNTHPSGTGLLHRGLWDF